MKSTEIWDNGGDMPVRFEDGTDTLFISGFPGGSSGDVTFLNRLASVAGRSLIRHVHVRFTSNIRNCHFVAMLPGIESLILQSARMESLLGLSESMTLKRLVVDAGGKNKIDLSDLKGKAMEFVQLRGARPEDVEVFSESHIGSLELTGGGLLDLKTLAGARIDDLVLTRLPIREIGRIDSLGVSRLSLTLCGELSGFSSDNSTVKWLTIEACNNLQIRTLSHLKTLRALRLLACRQRIDLGELSIATRGEEIVLSKCDVSLDAMSLKLPDKLTRLWITPLRSPIARKISEINPRTLVSNGKSAFCAGGECNLSSYYLPASGGGCARIPTDMEEPGHP